LLPTIRFSTFGILESLFERAGLNVQFTATYADRETDNIERPVMSRLKEHLFECNLGKPEAERRAVNGSAALARSNRFDQGNDRPTFAKVIKIIRPRLHHSDAIAPELRGMHVSCEHRPPLGAPAGAQWHPGSIGPFRSNASMP
jgi:hypothetical protein